jgi:hypothetical protein
MAILSNISEIFEFAIHDHISHILKSKLNLSHHDFIKSESTVNNLVTFLDFFTLLVCSQWQNDSVYFDFINAFDILPHAQLYHKLSNCRLSSCYLNWFLSYLINRHLRVR